MTTYQITVGADDGRILGTVFSVNLSPMYAGVSGVLDCRLFLRFPGVTILPHVDTAVLEVWGQDPTGSPLLKVYGVDEDDPPAPTSTAEYDADPLTAGIDWDGQWTHAAWSTSPSLVAIFQALRDSYNITDKAVMLQIKNDGGGDGDLNRMLPVETLEGAYAAKLTITSSVIAAGRSRGFIIG